MLETYTVVEGTIHFTADDITRSRAAGFAVRRMDAVDCFVFDRKLPCVYLAALLFGAPAAENAYSNAGRFESGASIFPPTLLKARDGPGVTGGNDGTLGRLVEGVQLQRLGIIDHETIVTITIGSPTDRPVRGDAGCTERGKYRKYQERSSRVPRPLSVFAFIPHRFQINSHLLSLLIKMRALQPQRPRCIRNLIVIAFQLGKDGLLLKNAHTFSQRPA